ncbi:bifunctional hydroxymethylpyrimidine kinase/phosphomethylpyrimidine kinase [Methanimicrococcus blatticola]|uniref:Hydroxymethylpyrimidine/phosphomethylpyrimidine kinase n=1 Tax=Methanimicrococcus blatticola TaxID=91560 RepID=A0A484F528_9EURY|nr:bifunctional hydroxymethylpyrimidine kinase/phosphomethylpyrimidine kinase [Methanimicrococcus blatticola]MBZ3936040.1 bifunctional hydroxymethylpyrimidine kinase/phosphomethylpyrimidine kinase [Methanimicrococcus blatticola]MCC2509348.1 bifunctional hydroxymethylpyrimidine kinase/phosphomethylpyrimidine kinase [Methanimicrococcus blatticola]TDQ68231.1 hydroxymethylpyrimidine/phosphomethylpyrimidine kinase [Methanimicrococcus blatticola]
MTHEKTSKIKKKCVMTIAGSDSGGGAGIEADLKTFSALGVHGACVIASVTSQNTTGVQSVFDIPVEHIGTQMDSVCTDMNIVFAKSGMLSSPEIVQFVAGKVKEYGLSLVVDPVMAAEAGGELLRKEAVEMMAEALLPVSYAVTPNIFEAEILSGLKIKNADDAKAAAVKIAETGVKYVIVTGGHLDAEDIVYDSENKEFTLLSGTFVKGGTHGTGCTYSSALVSYLARGYTFEEACRFAKKFVVDAILYSENIGSGVAPVNPGGASTLFSERAAVIENILEAWEILKDDDVFPQLIPEVGTNIAMTLPDRFKESVQADYYASGIQPPRQMLSIDKRDRQIGADGFGSYYSAVASFPGRIHKMKDLTGTKLSAENLGYPSFGAGSNLARVIKSAQEFDETIRACINLKYTEKTVKHCEQSGFSAYAFTRDDEPCGCDESKEWGTSVVIQENGETVPDIIYENGGFGKEGIIRVLGTDAVDAAVKVIMICDDIRKQIGGGEK